MLWRHFPGNLVSSSNGVKVVGITGSTVNDIEDLVVATVIPGLGKDMPTVEVNESPQKVQLTTQIQFRLTPTVWTLRGCSSERIACSLGTSAVSLEHPEITGFKIIHGAVDFGLSSNTGPKSMDYIIWTEYKKLRQFIV